MITHDALIAASQNCYADTIEVLSDAQKCATHNLPKSVIKKLEQAEQKISWYRSTLLLLTADDPNQWKKL
ncbi:MAG: hypothetical protein ACRCV9_03580 [Burkholderiaceae bacterium]